MSDMVEWVARALIEAHGDHEAMPAADYLRMARAAIAAMREPTEAMLVASGDPSDSTCFMWRAMIDAALAESDPPHIIAAPNRLG